MLRSGDLLGPALLEPADLSPGSGPEPRVDLVGEPRDLRASSVRWSELDGEREQALFHPAPQARVHDADQVEDLGLEKQPLTGLDRSGLLALRARLAPRIGSDVNVNVFSLEISHSLTQRGPLRARE